MKNGIFVTGTGTGVGKTLCTAVLLQILRDEGLDAVPMKPVQTGAEKDSSGNLIAPDLNFLLQIAGIESRSKELSLMNPYLYQPACSPHLAANLEDRPIEISKITSAFFELLQEHQFVIAEGAGGALVPLDSKLLMTDLMRELDLPVVVVANSQLGTINHTLLTLEALRNRGISVLGLILSDQDENAADDFIANDNTKLLTERAGVPLLMRVPFLPEINAGIISSLSETFRKQGVGKQLISLLSKQSINLNELCQADHNHLWHPFTDIRRYESQETYTVFDRATGSYLIDSSGNKFLDGFSSWWCANLGHSHPAIITAVQKRASELQQCILGDIAHPDGVLLAKELAELAPGDLNHVFYASDGSSAVEAALKISMQYWWNKGVKGKKKFIYFENSYHGDTLGAVSVGYIEAFHSSLKDFIWPNIQAPTPFTTDTCPLDRNQESWAAESFATVELLLRKHADEVAALIIEPLCQAAGGMRIYHPEYLRRLRSVCDEVGVLLIADEIAVGFGRTGPMFACEKAQIVPDLLVLGKGLTSGFLPMSAVVATPEIYDSFRNESETPERNKTFFHGHTYSGHPLAAVCAREVLRIFKDERVLEGIPRRAEILQKGFRELAEFIPQSRSNSLGMIAMLNVPAEVGGIRFARAVTVQARARGLFIRSVGDVLYLFPPLNASEVELRMMISKLGEAIRGVG